MLFSRKNTVEARKCLDKRYRDSAPGKSTIIDWYAEFKRGRTNTDGSERSSRLKSAAVPENITKVLRSPQLLGGKGLAFSAINKTLSVLTMVNRG